MSDDALIADANLIEIARLRADNAALLRIVQVADELRIAMRDVETAQTRMQDEPARYRTTLRWRVLREMLEQAALTADHPGAALLAELTTARAHIHELRSALDVLLAGLTDAAKTRARAALDATKARGA